MDQINYQDDINGQKVNKIVLDPAHDFGALGLPAEALALLQNIKTVSSEPAKKSITLDSSVKDVSSLGIPDEAQMLLHSIKEKERKEQSDKYKSSSTNAIPKLIFVDGKFIVPPELAHKETKSETPTINNRDFTSTIEVKKQDISNVSIVTPTSDETHTHSNVSQPMSLNPLDNIMSLSDLINNTSNSGVSVSSTNNYTNRDKEQALVKGLTVHEEGMFLGIILGGSDKNFVIKTMEEYSSVKFNPDGGDSILEFDDISVTIYFEDNIADMFEFGKKFKGHTSKGLSIGSPLDKAIEIYGNPTMKSPRGAVWKGFKVFCQDGEITSIKVQRS
jgi:hypothetical protein